MEMESNHVEIPMSNCLFPDGLVSAAVDHVVNVDPLGIPGS